MVKSRTRLAFTSALAIALCALVAAGCIATATPTPAGRADHSPTPAEKADHSSTPTATLAPSPTGALEPTPTPTAHRPQTSPPTPAPDAQPASPTPAFAPTTTPTPHPTPAKIPDYPFVLAQPISEVWDADPELGAELVAAPWLADGIGRLEPNAVYGLLRLYDWDPALARQMFAYSIEEPVRDRNVLILNALGDMTWQNPDSFELLLRQPWFTDGLDAEERALIIALQKIADPGQLYDDFLESRSVLRSQADGVDIWVFHHGAESYDNGANALQIIERAIEGNLELMGAPFPLTDVIVLAVNTWEYDWNYVGGVNFGDSILLALASDRKTVTQRLLDHEIAHYYLAGEVGPLWLVEGGANFAATYLQAGRDGKQPESNEWVLEECTVNGVPDIHALSNPNPPDPEWRDTCDYILGQYFMTALYDAIGLDAYAGALRELYDRYVRYESPATDEQIYRAFLKHTPPDREAAFLDVYRRLHGGPFLDEE